MHASVITGIVKPRMAREILLLGMLEDKYAILFQHVAPQYHIHHLLAPLQIIRRVGEYHVEPFGTTLKIEEYVRLHRVHRIETIRSRRRTDEVMMHGVDLDRGDRSRTA